MKTKFADNIINMNELYKKTIQTQRFSTRGHLHLETVIVLSKRSYYSPHESIVDFIALIIF